jgi:hypothetical protein
MARRGRRVAPKPKRVATLAVAVFDNGGLEIKPRGGPAKRARWDEFQTVASKLLKNAGLNIETQVRLAKPGVVKRAIKRRPKPAPAPPVG